ncbi:hypothetical protein LR48_Vigan02g140600 [Vigna angularis]|uniref:Uncharacterized protein n=1 Tax=Phaseolus angularis TaxID=3914 RepID=A0A0L9TXM8_PHAAN|nr:hypothetical protein LR48_Vigan02g140600 [Vigna angularis]
MEDEEYVVFGYGFSCIRFHSFIHHALSLYSVPGCVIRFQQGFTASSMRADVFPWLMVRAVRCRGPSGSDAATRECFVYMGGLLSSELEIASI